MANNPTLTVAKLKSTLMNTVDLKSSLSGKMVTGGRLNIAKALGASEPSPNSDVAAPSAVSDLAATNATHNSLTLTWR